MLHKRVRVERHLPREIRVVQHCGLAVEGQARLCRAVADAVEAPHEVKVPCRAPELAVGYHVVARGLLLGDKAAYGLIFGRLQRRGVDSAALKIRARLLECGGAEKTADKIITEWCVHVNTAPLLSDFSPRLYAVPRRKSTGYSYKHNRNFYKDRIRAQPALPVGRAPIYMLPRASRRLRRQGLRRLCGISGAAFPLSVSLAVTVTGFSVSTIFTVPVQSNSISVSFPPDTVSFSAP